MLPESSTTDSNPPPHPNPIPDLHPIERTPAAVQDVDPNNSNYDDDDFPFRFGFPPRPGPPPASALGSQIGPDRRLSSAPAPLLKHNSWSPDSLREETWQRRKDLHRRRRKDGAGGGRMCRSVTEEDLEELRGCIDLGFGFEEEDEEQQDQEEIEGGTPNSHTSSGSGNKKLWELLPALDLYYAVRRSSKQQQLLPPPSPSAASVPAGIGAAAGLMSSSSSSSAGSSPLSLYSPGDSPREVKARLKQWAQVVACSVRQQRY